MLKKINKSCTGFCPALGRTALFYFCAFSLLGYSSDGLTKYKEVPPLVGTVCGSMYDIALEKPGINFMEDVGKQGTGITSDGEVKTCARRQRVRARKGKVVARCTALQTVNARPTDSDGRVCDSSKGEVIGSNSVCLLPAFMVAGDPRCNSMGDIIYIKELEGVSFPVPGTTAMLKHPGYFMVEDTGGDVKGCDRFDFFAGKAQLKDRNNPFGFSGEAKMTDKSDCSRNYVRIPFDPNPDSDWTKASKIIYAVYDKLPGAQTQTPPKGSAAIPAGGSR